MQDFVDQLSVWLNRRDLSATAFGASVGVDHMTMSRIMRRRRAPDLDKLEEWADALGLIDEDRQAFIVAGQLAHTPPGIRDLLAKLEQAAAEDRQRLAELSSVLKRLEERYEALLRGQPSAVPGEPPAAPRR